VLRIEKNAPRVFETILELPRLGALDIDGKNLPGVLEAGLLPVKLVAAAMDEDIMSSVLEN